MRRRKRGSRVEDNGFAEWGGYMEAKKAKLQNQFNIDAAKEPSTNSTQIFHGIAIFVNGYSVPSADELKLLMMKHGGIYHHYYRTNRTTHVIATNLPDTKVKQLKNMKVVKPEWIVDSIAAGKLLDYRQYLLYSNHSKTQPKIMFKQTSDQENKPGTSSPSISVIRDFKSETETISDSEVLALTNKLSEESAIKNICTTPSEFDEKCIMNKPKSLAESASVPSTTKNAGNMIKTASEAGFLSEFYSNSRLHHISTMGAMFKQYVNNLRDKNITVFPGSEKMKIWKQNQSSNLTTVTTKYSNIVMHIDMDCFFVSVGIRKRPELRGFPVAVTHAKAGGESRGSHRAGVNRKAEFDLYKIRKEEKSRGQSIVPGDDVKPWSDWVDFIDESNSMSEIASCNYEARKVGLKNGMFLGQALKLCPNLKTIPYDFEAYKEVSYCLYDTVASYTLDIEAVSCDEMFVDCSSILNSTGATPMQLASLLREQIKEKTGCPCSTGFGSNRLQARLATKKAKPDGQFLLTPSAVQTFMEDISVSDLPGVGRSTSYKLASMGIKTCLDLQQIPLTKLQSEFGMKIGASLYKHCRGEDTKKLVFGQIRKSVSAEVNYGIRLNNSNEAETFLQELSKEVHNRLQEVNMKTKCVTLKLMVKAKDAPEESAKFLGHGVCDHISRSSALPLAVSDVHSIIREVMSLSRQLKIEPTELRGIGIQLSRLVSAQTSKPSGNVIDKFLYPKSETTKANEKDQQNNGTSATATNNRNRTIQCTSSSVIDAFFVAKRHSSSDSKQTLCNNKHEKHFEIDKDVLEALPEDIRQEVLQEYGLGQQGSGNGSKETSEANNPPLSDQINYSQIDLEVLDELPIEIKNEIKSSIITNKTNLAMKTSTCKPGISDYTNKESCLGTSYKTEESKLDKTLLLSEVMGLIKAWTSSEESPQNCDINMLADYLEGLVVNRQLDSLQVCVNCLHRCIEKRESEQWKKAYYTIISSVQTVMLAVYGLHLWVPKTFN